MGASFGFLIIWKNNLRENLDSWPSGLDPSALAAYANVFRLVKNEPNDQNSRSISTPTDQSLLALWYKLKNKKIIIITHHSRQWCACQASTALTAWI